MNTPELMTVREAAAMCRVGQTTFRNVIAPKIPHVRIGRKIFWERGDIIQWLEAQKAGSLSKEAASIRSASERMVSVSLSPRASEMLAKLRSSPRRSIRTPSQGNA